MIADAPGGVLPTPTPIHGGMSFCLGAGIFEGCNKKPREGRGFTYRPNRVGLTDPRYMENGVLVLVSHDQLQFLDTIPVAAKLVGHHPGMPQGVIVTGKLTPLVIADVRTVSHVEEVTPHMLALGFPLCTKSYHEPRHDAKLQTVERRY